MADEHYTRKDLDEVAQAAAERAINKFGPNLVKETLANLGIDADDKTTVQRQMMFLRDAADRAYDTEVEKDRLWTRANRERCEKVYASAANSAIRVIVIAVLGILGLGIYVYMSGGRLP